MIYEAVVHWGGQPLFVFGKNLSEFENLLLKSDRKDVKMRFRKWPIGQVVKTAASHAVNIGSNPVWVTNFFLDKSRKKWYNV